MVNNYYKGVSVNKYFRENHELVEIEAERKGNFVVIEKKWGKLDKNRATW